MEVLHFLITDSPFDPDTLPWKVWIGWKDLEEDLRRFLGKHIQRNVNRIEKSHWNILTGPDLFKPLADFLFVVEVILEDTPLLVQLHPIDIITPVGTSRALQTLMGFLVGVETPNLCGGLVSWRTAANLIRSNEVKPIPHLGAYYLPHPSVEKGIEGILAQPQLSLIDQLCRDHLGCQLGPTLLSILHWRLFLLSLPLSVRLSDPPPRVVLWESALREIEHGHLPFGTLQGRVLSVRRKP